MLDERRERRDRKRARDGPTWESIQQPFSQGPYIIQIYGAGSRPNQNLDPSARMPIYKHLVTGAGWVEAWQRPVLLSLAQLPCGESRIRAVGEAGCNLWLADRLRIVIYDQQVSKEWRHPSAGVQEKPAASPAGRSSLVPPSPPGRPPTEICPVTSARNVAGWRNNLKQTFKYKVWLTYDERYSWRRDKGLELCCELKGTCVTIDLYPTLLAPPGGGQACHGSS